MFGENSGGKKDGLSLPKPRDWPTEREKDRMNCISAARNIRRMVSKLVKASQNPDVQRDLHAITDEAVKIEITLIEARSTPIQMTLENTTEKGE
jgi:hypothetical protein